MAKKATALRRKFVVSLLESAVTPEEQLDIQVLCPETALTSIDKLALGIMPLIVNSEDALKQYNQVFSDHADWGRVEESLAPFIAWCARRGQKVDLKRLTKKQRQWLKALIWDSKITIKLLVSGELTFGGRAKVLPRDQRSMSSSKSPIDITASAFASPREMLFSPEKFGWEKSQPIRFSPMILHLTGLCNFTSEHTTVKPEDSKKIGEHMAEKLDSFLRLVEMKHPHLRMGENSIDFFPPEIRKWAKKNIRWVNGLEERMVLLTLLDLTLKMKLVSVDPECGGMLLTHNASEALVRPEIYADHVRYVLPMMNSAFDQPIALLDSLIAYLGGPIVAEAMHVTPMDLSKVFREFSVDMGDKYLSTMQQNYIARCILGLQQANFKDLAGEKQLSDTGKLLMRCSLALRLQDQIEWVLQNQGKLPAN